MIRSFARRPLFRIAVGSSVAILLVAGVAWFGWNRSRAARWEKGLRVAIPHGKTISVDGIEVIPDNLDRIRHHVLRVVPASGRDYYGVALVLDPDPDATFAEMDAVAFLPFRKAVPGAGNLFPDEGPRISFDPVFELDGVRREFVTDDPWHQVEHNPFKDILWVRIGTEKVLVGGRISPWQDFPDGGEALDRFVADSTNLDAAFFAVGVEPDVPFKRVKAVLHALCAACPSNNFCFFNLR